jgi:hypothetical protein
MLGGFTGGGQLDARVGRRREKAALCAENGSSITPRARASSWARPKRFYGFYVGCTLSCASIMASGRDVYTSRYQDQEEWPTPFELS